MGERQHRRKLAALTGLVTLLMVCAILLAGEMIARRIGPTPVEGLESVPHPTLGWLPRSGMLRATAREFDTALSVNTHGMNDREVEPLDLERANRLLVLGDSHTFAVGVSTAEAWPKLLEAALFADGKGGAAFNAAVYGYALGQYLERFRTLRDTLKPTHVLVGFSMATDLYDLLPPERGGFIYGGDAPRRYFDLDGDGRLIEKMHDRAASGASQKSGDASTSLRGMLEGSALYRALKRSQLALTLAMYFRPGGTSLWPGLDTALKRELSGDDRYRWQLAEAILARLAEEARASGARVTIVNIPYLAQVYDEVWAASFGRLPAIYDREIASRRLGEICQRIGADLIDTAPAFEAAVRERKRWLHWRYDGHPNAEGQRLIADVVAARLREILP